MNKILLSVWALSLPSITVAYSTNIERVERLLEIQIDMLKQQHQTLLEIRDAIKRTNKKETPHSKVASFKTPFSFPLSFDE